MRPPSLLRPRRNAGGFTLVELLVAIGIIVLLIGLLLSALSKARRTTNDLTCESNLRQWGLATQIYAGENHGNLPRRGQGVNPTLQIARPTDWFNALPPILKLKPYMDLASDNQIARPPGSSVWICREANDMAGAYYWSYGMNMALSVWEGNQNQGQPDKITAVGDTATMVFLADAPGNYCSVIPSQFTGGYNPVPRHAGRVNICFLDGHVDAIDGSYIGCGTGLVERPDVRWHPPNSTWTSAQ